MPQIPLVITNKAAGATSASASDTGVPGLGLSIDTARLSVLGTEMIGPHHDVNMGPMWIGAFNEGQPLINDADFDGADPANLCRYYMYSEMGLVFVDGDKGYRVPDGISLHCI